MIGRWRRSAYGLVLLGLSGIASAQVTLYERENFGGRAFRASDSVANLDETGFNDRAASVDVRGGRWQLCDDAGFRGRCVTVEAGQYPSLREMGLDRRVSSVRELGWTPDGRGGFHGGPVGRDRDRDRDRDRGPEPRAVLFSGPGLSGEALALDAGGVGDLKNSGFNDRARSLRVEGGTWVFCSDAHFGGSCQTYGPGDYPRLPRGQSDAISSGRLVAEGYASGGGPRWDRGRGR